LFLLKNKVSLDRIIEFVKLKLEKKLSTDVNKTMPRSRRTTIPYEMEKLGTFFKQLRGEAELSIREAAKKSEIAPSYLSKIEAGDTFSTITVQTLIKLSKTYNIPPVAILKEAGLVDSDEYELPDLPQYLRAKYHLSPQAIRDMEMAKEIVDKKYQTFKK